MRDVVAKEEPTDVNVHEMDDDIKGASRQIRNMSDLIHEVVIKGRSLE